MIRDTIKRWGTMAICCSFPPDETIIEKVIVKFTQFNEEVDLDATYQAKVYQAFGLIHYDHTITINETPENVTRLRSIGVDPETVLFTMPYHQCGDVKGAPGYHARRYTTQLLNRYNVLDTVD